MDGIYAVWVGRIQPFHLGHLRVLKRSLETWAAPHINGIVSHDYDFLNADPPGKHSRRYNPFSPWERYFMVRTCLISVGLAHRVDTIYIPFSKPYLEPADWTALRRYLPNRFFLCTTNKDSEDLGKADAWSRLGWKSVVVDVSGLEVFSSTDLRREILAGRDWRQFIHESLHGYFESIDGPARLWKSANEVADLAKRPH